MLNCDLFFAALCKIPFNLHTVHVLLERSIIVYTPENIKLMTALIRVFPQSISLLRPSVVMCQIETQKVPEATFLMTIDLTVYSV